jgi:parallel beta-helix repeat protein
MKNLVASFNRSYGLFAFDCIGGRITKSVGKGHGDSAFYIGATPFQDKPKWTSLDHLEAYKNNLGYSGTNSKYVKITKSDYYNNGTGIVPNTLDSEPYEPTATGIIENNNIFWNNFNYFLPLSPVETVSGGLGQIGDATVNYPTGVGIVLLGSDGWTIQNNEIFGNFKYGSVALSFPGDLNEGDDAINLNNQFLNNTNGREGTDTNAVDFYNDGSGSGNCFQGNVSSTFDPSPTATNAFLYPSCPAPAPPASGTGTSTADPGQFVDLAYALTDPPENQQCSWTEHPHPPFEDFEPYEVPGFDPAVCP